MQYPPNIFLLKKLPGITVVKFIFLSLAPYPWVLFSMYSCAVIACVCLSDLWGVYV